MRAALGDATDAKSNEITAIRLTDTLIKCGGHEESVDAAGIHLISIWACPKSDTAPPGGYGHFLVNFPEPLTHPSTTSAGPVLAFSATGTPDSMFRTGSIGSTFSYPAAPPSAGPPRSGSIKLNPLREVNW